MRPRSGLRAAGPLVVGSLVVSGGCSIIGGADSSDAPTTPSPAERVTWARAAVTAMVDAATARSADAAADPAPSGQAAATLVANARLLRVGDLRLDLDDEVPGSSATSGADAAGAAEAAEATSTWTMSGRLRWRFAGFDRQPSTVPVLARFSASAGTGVATFEGLDAPRDSPSDQPDQPDQSGDVVARVPTWAAGRAVRVVRTDGVMVLTAGASPARYLRLALAARRSVVGLLEPSRPRAEPGGALPRVVVEVPRDAAALGAALGAAPGEYDAVAAVTAAVDGSTDRSAPQHVYVNDGVFDTLHGTGARVVLTHEVTHEVTGAATANAPTWLVEGFADYVALRHVRLPRDVTAARIIARVRAEGLPDALPADRAFDPTTTGLDATYEAAWLACTVLAERGGDPALVDLYREVSDGRPLEAALRADYGLSTADVVGLWRERLQDLAR